MKMNMLPTTTCIALAIWALAARAQAPDLGTLPPYKKEFEVVGRLRIAGVSIDFTADNVASRRYPLARDAYVYFDKPPGRPMDPKVREFLRFVLGREGQEIIAKSGPYTPIPADYLRLQLKKLD